MALERFSQNDPRWKNKRIGNSTCTIGRWGCTISSIATLGTYFGERKTPDELASKLDFTNDGRILWQSISRVYDKMKFKWRFYTFDKNLIDKSLSDPNTVVLLNVDHNYHWISALSKIFGYYRCSDPWTYPAKIRLVKALEIGGGCILTRK